MTLPDTALAVLVIASLKTDVYRVTVARVQGAATVLQTKVKVFLTHIF